MKCSSKERTTRLGGLDVQLTLQQRKRTMRLLYVLIKEARGQFRQRRSIAFNFSALPAQLLASFAVKERRYWPPTREVKFFSKSSHNFMLES